MVVGYNDSHEKLICRLEAEFASVVRNAVKQRKHGQFGLIVFLRDGKLSTIQRHNVETFK